MSRTGKYDRFAVTTDVVIFSIIDGALKVLLIERGREPFKGQWALPGGFVHAGESVTQCARRELAEETGVVDVYLEQLYSFGAVERDPRERVITIAYFALVPLDKTEVRAASDAHDARWFALPEVPKLAFDHREILARAHDRLIAKLGYSTIALQMMPPEFTLSELQEVYEIIGGHPLDKRNFRKSILALDVVSDTGKMRAEGAHRPARLFRAAASDTVTIIR